MRSRLVLLLMALTLCVGILPASAQDEPTQPMIPELALGGFGGGTNPQANFNPFSINALAGFAYLYEPLYVINGAACQEVPWLATSYAWADSQTLTMTMREGVVWSDGTPLTAADTAFTFNLLKQFPALDRTGVWASLQSVEASGNSLTFRFTQPGAGQIDRVFNVLTVPQHIWSGVADPVTFVNEQPVGSGPFAFERFNGQQLTMVRNPSFWAADKVRIERLVYKGAAEGQVDQLLLAEGEYDWNALFIPDVEQTYVSRDPEHNKYWFLPDAPISLYFNLTMAPFDNPEFRRGISYAIDRQAISDRAVYGYTPPASQTGLVLPIQEANLAPNLPHPNGIIPFDQAQAVQILSAAGFVQDGEGRMIGPDGNQVAFTFSVQAGWADWVQAADILRENLAAIGIEVDVQPANPDIVINSREIGEYQATFGVPPGGCNLFRVFYEPLGSAVTAPVGESADSNFIRYQDPATDEILARMQAATTPEEVTAISHELQNVMLTQTPYIPLWYGPIWFEYRTENATNWPSPENPYADGNDGLLIVTNLMPPAAA
ncbi:MAG TPA: ABC transporter substrate-binding protein [Thermomicrobiales bacterium]|nr:ABC transporter substrate-binding protein [Thermomicrobiales bacterium]